ncbi:GNAT family N-acetyltransferase [Clostridium estertheticum]|uniref:GNAT family N-acetyltransferase n=1 Tax=Clostridium estertheticum TaxID=238834 RepID=UPI001C0C1123|nr:GNAT family N-acetyltransferase [Clostridium estertheticum]MBU3173328.1 GNAT family N-acetyltransferase [Clostridium estertheticum]
MNKYYKQINFNNKRVKNTNIIFDEKYVINDCLDYDNLIKIFYQGREIAFLTIHPCLTFVKLHRLHVLEEFQGQGLGRKLMLRLIEWCDLRKIKRVSVMHFGNKDLIDFYEKFGFDRVTCYRDKKYNWLPILNFKHKSK